MRSTLTDPLADPAEAARDYGRTPIELNGEAYDLVVAAVAHDEYRALDDGQLAGAGRRGRDARRPQGHVAGARSWPPIDRWTL